MQTSGWDLRPGDTIKRTDLHTRYGGRTQGGIAPSTRSSNVMIFSGPSGHKYGYFDGWQSDGCFHYAGEGQTGDQQLKQGNRALAEHAQANKSVRVFSGVSGQVTYVGEFRVDPEKPYYRTDAPALGEDAMREVIVFRLRPISDMNEICKVLTNGRHPILFLAENSVLPKGPVDVICNGKPMKARVVKIAVNVLTEGDGKGRNQMPEVLRGWFGEDAGKPGRKDFVQFRKQGRAWVMQPVMPSDAMQEYRRDLLPVAEEELEEKHTSVNEIDPENRSAEQFTSGAIAERVAERREAALIIEYLEFRRASALSRLRRLKIKPEGEVQPLYTDLYDPDSKLIIEAKGTVTREAIRMAVGQLLDYSRFGDQPKQLAILLPEVPRQDLLDFLHSYKIAVIVQRKDGRFETISRSERQAAD